MLVRHLFMYIMLVGVYVKKGKYRVVGWGVGGQI